jgi:hypothetical protein
MTFDNECNKILKTLNENYTLTLRQILYSRYGKNLADKIISDINASGQDDYLQQKFKLPNYSKENLDRVIPVEVKQLAPGIGGQARATMTITNTPFGQKKSVKHNIFLNANEPYEKSGIAELEGGPVSYEREDGLAYDVNKHEATHTAQDSGTSNLRKSKLTGGDLQYEFAPVLAELKGWYYLKTGIALGYDANHIALGPKEADEQWEKFMNYCRQRNAFNELGYGSEIDFEKMLNSSEGRAAMRRIAKTAPIKSNTMAA